MLGKKVLEMNEIKLSVCLSLYNASKFVNRCLDALCAQTLEDKMEIVLVNDGSTDDTETKIEAFVRNHPERSFVIVSQENKSLCQGRLAGIQHASGDYIGFLDVDDLIDKDAYKIMLDCAESTNADIVEIRTRHGNKILGAPFLGLQDSHMVLKHYFTQGGIQSMLWLRIYKRRLFQKPVLPSIYTNNEDMYGLPCLLHAARNIFFLPDVLHTYSLDNDNSVMAVISNPQNQEKRYKSRIIALGQFNHFSSFVGDEGMKEYYNEFNQYKATYLFSFLMMRFVNKPMDVKISDVINETNFISRKELESFLHVWLPNKKILYVFYKIFGLSVTCTLFTVVKRLLATVK